MLLVHEEGWLPFKKKAIYLLALENSRENQVTIWAVDPQNIHNQSSRGEAETLSPPWHTLAQQASFAPPTPRSSSKSKLFCLSCLLQLIVSIILGYVSLT